MYGMPAMPVPDTKLTKDDRFDSRQKIIATWADSLYS